MAVKVIYAQTKNTFKFQNIETDFKTKQNEFEFSWKAPNRLHAGLCFGALSIYREHRRYHSVRLLKLNIEKRAAQDEGGRPAHCELQRVRALGGLLVAQRQLRTHVHLQRECALGLDLGPRHLGMSACRGGHQILALTVILIIFHRCGRLRTRLAVPAPCGPLRSEPGGAHLGS